MQRERLASGSRPSADALDERSLRLLAIEQVENRRRLKFHLTAFLLGVIILGGPWLAIEYLNADGWPQRFSDQGKPGDWNPTVLVILIAWALLLAIHAVKIHFRREPTPSEMERALEQLRSG